MFNRITPISSEQLESFAEIVGLNLSVLLAPPNENAWFQKRHSIVLYTGKLFPQLSSIQMEGIIIADWLGKKTLRIYPSLPVLFPTAFLNVIKTDSPFFVQGRNLHPSQFQWIRRESNSRRSLVLDSLDIPLGIGLLKSTSDGKDMFINEVDIGGFFRQEKKAKRKMRR